MALAQLESAVVDHDAVRREHGYHPLRVKRIVDETPDTRSFVLQVPDGDRDLFSYQAGQFCTFRVRIGDEELLRSYSMSSAPETDDDLTVTVKRVDGGQVSNWFNDNVDQGDVLEATKPAGVFCLRHSDRPVIGFTGGSGVTPVMAITKTALTTSTRPVRLLCANRDAGSVIFRDDLEQLRTEHGDRLKVRHHLDVDGGFLEAEAITTFVADDLDADFYICGPGPFMDLVEHTLLELGVDTDQIFIERFEIAPELAADPPPTDDAAPTDTVTPAEVTIILKGKKNTVAYHPGDTLLQTARRGGLQAPSSCEAGDCATCMALLHEGSVTMRTNNALTPEEVEEGWVLTCQSLPEGPMLTVEYESF